MQQTGISKGQRCGSGTVAAGPESFRLVLGSELEPLKLFTWGWSWSRDALYLRKLRSVSSNVVSNAGIRSRGLSRRGREIFPKAGPAGIIHLEPDSEQKCLPEVGTVQHFLTPHPWLEYAHISMIL